MPAAFQDQAVEEKQKQEQMKLQKEMQLLEERARGFQASAGGLAGGVAAAAERKRELHELRLREYESFEDFDPKREKKDDLSAAVMPSDAVVEGGTYEHRRRAKEMLQTAEAAFQSTNDTSTGGGKRTGFVGDYLPKAELEKFLKKASAAAAGEEYQQSDFEASQLDASNKGFQMLQGGGAGQGWQAGQGLGKEGQGVVAPVSVGGSGQGGAGVGSTQKSTHEVQQSDDEFDTFRKRMMLSYRFRPNPMNNPRRNYY